MRSTRTYAILEVSAGAYAEIRALLHDAGYQHAFHDDVIDMHGIALKAMAPELTMLTSVAKLAALRQALDDLPLVMHAETLAGAHAVQTVINAARDIVGGKDLSP